MENALANLAQTISNSLLLHTGYFRQLAWIAAGTAVAMTLMTAIAVAMRLDITGYMATYAAAFAVSVLFSVAVMIRGPIRAAGG